MTPNLKKRARVFIDQHGRVFRCWTLKELQELAGGGRMGKIYETHENGVTVHVGYYVGRFWLVEYQPIERQVE